MEPTPISSRQPRQEDRIEESFPEIDEEEQPPESGEVASQRKPTTQQEPAPAAALPEWDAREPAAAAADLPRGELPGGPDSTPSGLRPVEPALRVSPVCCPTAP